MIERDYTDLALTIEEFINSIDGIESIVAEFGLREKLARFDEWYCEHHQLEGA